MMHATSQCFVPSSEKTHFVSRTYLVMFQRQLGRLCCDGTSLAMRSDATVAQHDRIDSAGLSPLLEQLHRAYGHMCFGLDTGFNTHPSDYGIFGYAMMNCPTMLHALQQAARYKPMLSAQLSAQLVTENGHLRYRLARHMDSALYRVLTEMDFSSALAFAKRLAGPNRDQLVTFTRVRFTHEALGPEQEYERVFGCPVEFGAQFNEIEIAPEVLALPVYGANPRVFSALEERILRMSPATRKCDVPFKDQVAYYVRDHMSQCLPSSRDAASAFNMSLSAFKKKLSQEDTCFQRVCDAVRYKRSLELMESTEVSIKRIAYQLGFANASAFNRAFKRWSGACPSEVMRQPRNRHAR